MPSAPAVSLRPLLFCAGVAWLAAVPTRASLALPNPGFETGLEGWKPLFTRDPQSGRATPDAGTFHGGRAAVRLEHTGARDWSFESAERLTVEAGDVLELQAWLKVQSGSGLTLGVSTWDASGRNLSWSHGAQTTRVHSGWQLVRARFVVPEGVTRIQPRLLGSGPMVAWADDFSLERKFNLRDRRGTGFPAKVAVASPTLAIEFHTGDATLVVVDRRPGGRQWSQRRQGQDLLVTGATASRDRLEIRLFHATSGVDFTAVLQPDPDQPELLVTLRGEGALGSPVVFPHPFTGEPGDYLVVPMNEGISYPVDDPTIAPMRLIAYGGHGICMAFWGLTDGTRGQMALLETPDDASIRLDRLDGRLAIAPSWEAQRGAFGPERRLRYVFLNSGGHVAMAKRYRAYARQIGILKTLEEKRRDVPAVERLYGAANIWCWDKDAVAMARELQAAGLQRLLWSNRQGPEGIAAMNALGILTSRYDIYQDVMDPAQFPRLRGVHADWTTAAWPKDLILDRAGQWIHGWGVTAKDGTQIPCGVLCDRRALDYARERIPPELATHRYLGRFIDTTTASSWRECYHPDHPMTRSESRHWKMELLRYMSESQHLVTGSETGHDAAVPYLHFLEGMMSLGPYRVPDSGRRMQQIWDEVPERVAKFQLGHTYRLPLFELVFHDCVVSYWYWGDYNNKLPALWDKRDLFNVLYGAPPMYMFDRKFWTAHRSRFVQSYENTCPHIAKIAAAEMTDHRFLTPDRHVQETRFGNGTTITVNFGNAPYTLPDGAILGAGRYRVTEGR
ncbi:MAG: hypothetical protein HZC55_15135 [Verrucomicrobia bacterium]|nr:hypothetical protein [Verrucomicrobiota bacterium]